MEQQRNTLSNLSAVLKLDFGIHLQELLFFSSPKHTSTEIRDVKPLRLALKYSYLLFLKVCLLAACQWWNLCRVGSSVGLGLFFERWFGFLLLLLSPQTTACAGNAPLSLESF